jgi:thiol-disulfide isomerase/thioredoxin
MKKEKQKVIRIIFSWGLFAIALGSAVYAADKMTFNQAAFDADLKSGKSIMVGVHADWCPTCKKQSPVINGLQNDKKFGKVVFYKVNFDSDKEFLAKYNVAHQSTLLIFKNGKEIARSTGESDPEKIRALLEKGL